VVIQASGIYSSIELTNGAILKEMESQNFAVFLRRIRTRAEYGMESWFHFLKLTICWQNICNQWDREHVYFNAKSVYCNLKTIMDKPDGYRRL